MSTHVCDTCRDQPGSDTAREKGCTCGPMDRQRAADERVCVECDEPVDSQGMTTGDCPGGSGDKCDECFACSCDGSC